MVKFKVPIKDILALSYYRYELSSNNYNPALNTQITITCNCRNVFGNPVPDKALTLYENGAAIGTSNTDQDGNVNWTVTPAAKGLRQYRVGNSLLGIYIDNKAELGHTHTRSNITDFTHTHSTWNSVSISNGTIYYNSALRICELQYSRTFNSGQQNTMYEWGRLIPETYRPKHMITGNGNRNASTITIDTEGYVYGRFGIAFSSSTSFYYHLVWHY